jgi:uncharacterized protein YwqG
MPEMDRERLERLVHEHGLADAGAEIMAAARVGIVLDDVGPAGSEERTTRLGGHPDLPPAADWPSWRGRPLSPIAQIRLEDVARFDEEGVLPRAGLLSFFWDSGAVGGYAAGLDVNNAAGWGFDPADAGSARVLYIHDASSASRREPPGRLAPQAVLGARALAPRSRIAIPPWGSTDFDVLGLDVSQTEAYLGLSDALDRLQAAGDGSEMTHQLLGYPDQIQGDMQLESQLVTHGLYCGDGTGYADPRRSELESGAREWRLLLQVDSDPEGLGVMWGDGGRIYFWSRGRDLIEQRFDATWLLFQCA